MEGYIYLGQYYDVLGRELSLSDKKIGFSIDPVSREYQLNKTKSPIGYSIIAVYKVDNMNKVERMLHAILDSRRVFGEWFKDEEDTLTGEFINFMNIYGATPMDMNQIKEDQITLSGDDRLVKIANSFGKDTMLIRTYKGIDYDVLFSHIVVKVNDTIIDNNGLYECGSGWTTNLNKLSEEKLKEMLDIPKLWNNKFYNDENINNLINKLYQI